MMLDAGARDGLASLLRAASETESLLQRSGADPSDPAVGGSDTEILQRAARRLRDSVVRPLQEALAEPRQGRPSSGASPVQSLLAASAQEGLRGGHSAVVGERVWRLAQEATRLRLEPGAPAVLKEATAALQDLAIQLAGDDVDAQARLAELKRIQARLGAELEVSTDGPYLATNVEKLDNWLGESLATRPQMALCRCGASAIKPFCDGSHARVGFSGAKDPKRVPDRLDRYPGVQLTVLDNRGTCAHSGFCTDRLPSVFHAGESPFVTPSGARMDDIVRAVRSCPSGALSYAIDGHAQGVDVDPDRELAIEVSKDGPYRVTGAIRLVNSDGSDTPRNQGASQEHYSLCRCGHSQNKPFCSGMHWYVRFRDPLPDPDREPTLYEWAGGLPALTRMTRLFYEKHVPADPLIGPLFAAMAPDHPERVAAWLGEVFGGPKRYSQHYGGYAHMVSQHLGKCLTEAQRSRWAALMCRSADEAGLPADPEFRAAFVAYIEWGSRLAVENSRPGAHPPPQMPMPRWWWACDATPGARVSARGSTADEAAPVRLPTPDEPVSFASHVKPLFRATDRSSMRFAFDLWSLDDVTTHAQVILERLENGTMPCDGAWPPERIAVFKRWIESGKPV